MTEETQALVDQLREWVDGQSVTYASVLMQDAASALAALARDLETARQDAKCDVCSGTAVLLTGERCPCGSGHLSGMAIHLRLLLHDAEVKHAAAVRAALAA